MININNVIKDAIGCVKMSDADNNIVSNNFCTFPPIWENNRYKIPKKKKNPSDMGIIDEDISIL